MAKLSATRRARNTKPMSFLLLRVHGGAARRAALTAKKNSSISTEINYFVLLRREKLNSNNDILRAMQVSAAQKTDGVTDLLFLSKQWMSLYEIPDFSTFPLPCMPTNFRVIRKWAARPLRNPSLFLWHTR